MYLKTHNNYISKIHNKLTEIRHFCSLVGLALPPTVEDTCLRNRFCSKAIIKWWLTPEITVDMNSTVALYIKY